LELSLEKQIGQNSFDSIVAQKKVVKLPEEETRRLNAVYDRLVRVCPRRKELKFSLTVVEDETVNAFALPAGYIFVHTGLLEYVASDGELAGVLAHEIAHVDRKHSMSVIKRQLGMALLFQVFLSDASEELAKVGALAVNLAQLGYGRDAEYEADRYGVIFMEKAGYDRAEILNFWERLVKHSGGKEEPQILQLFSTHPPTAERIKRIKALPTPTQ
jgi:predicted Zn-dependent protease